MAAPEWMKSDRAAAITAIVWFGGIATSCVAEPPLAGYGFVAGTLGMLALFVVMALSPPSGNRGGGGGGYRDGGIGDNPSDTDDCDGDE